MKRCLHHHLMLMPEASTRLRCRHCHLTIKADELEMGYCPECFDASGKKHDDFETLTSSDTTRYRCEDCHAIIEYRPWPANTARKERTPV